MTRNQYKSKTTWVREFLIKGIGVIRFTTPWPTRPTQVRFVTERAEHLVPKKKMVAHHIMAYVSKVMGCNGQVIPDTLLNNF